MVNVNQVYVNITKLGFGFKLPGHPCSMYSDRGQAQVETTPGPDKSIILNIVAHQKNDDAKIEMRLSRQQARKLLLDLGRQLGHEIHGPAQGNGNGSSRSTQGVA